MKQHLLAFLTVLALLAALAGCTTQPAPSETAAPTGSAQPDTTASVETTAPTTPGESAAPVDTAAAPETETPAPEFRFTRENFPRLDGSTACLPMAEAVCSVLLGESRDQVQDLIHFNRTTQSFRNLMDGECELLLAGQPNAAVFDEMESRGFAYDMEQLGTDALVFLVNENNPVENITTEQLRGVYTGEITNWKELGGEDAPIIPLQRNEGAGSQALMKKLVMGDTPLMEAPPEYIPSSMGDLMTAVKSYDASANAIGYSVYYYAHDMEMAQGLKLLKVDGVEPCKDTIRSGEYPHLNAYYCVIAHSAPADSPTRILYDWLVTEDGQALLDAEGYVTNQ
ncbi:MAG: substrate-binding domain-containing protein [Oscillospiraceae bacterium]|nr:substrate-binding domain-containing protein [Oscillospiraceae bacterium]